MPRPKGTGKGRAKPATIRLPDDEDAFYRRKANEAGLSLNGYLTKLLVEGAVAEKVHEFAETMDQKIAALAAVGKTGGGGVPDEILLSIITSEALLAQIVSAQDVQVLYRAQEAARAKMALVHGGMADEAGLRQQRLTPAPPNGGRSWALRHQACD